MNSFNNCDASSKKKIRYLITSPHIRTHAQWPLFDSQANGEPNDSISRWRALIGAACFIPRSARTLENVAEMLHEVINVAVKFNSHSLALKPQSSSCVLC
jgi:hypothetical protein